MDVILIGKIPEIHSTESPPLWVRLVQPHQWVDSKLCQKCAQDITAAKLTALLKG